MIRNLTSSQLKIIYIYIYMYVCIYIFYFLAYSYIFLGTTSSFLSPIINNSHSLTISMLFRNLTLLCLFVCFFFFPYYLGNLIFVKSIVKIFIKPTIQTITGTYFSSLFLLLFFFFLKVLLMSHKCKFKSMKSII